MCCLIIIIIIIIVIISLVWFVPVRLKQLSKLVCSPVRDLDSEKPAAESPESGRVFFPALRRVFFPALRCVFFPALLCVFFGAARVRAAARDIFHDRAVIHG